MLVLMALSGAITPGVPRWGNPEVGDGGGGEAPGVPSAHPPPDPSGIPSGSLGRTRDSLGEFNITDTFNASRGSTFHSHCRLKFLQGKGGGDMELTITGNLARLFRYRLDDPWFNSGNQDGYVDIGDIDMGNNELGSFVETFEDRLEGTSQKYIDIKPLAYENRFKGMNLKRDEDGGADVREVRGLGNGSVDSTEPVVLVFQLKGSIAGANREILWTDGYVMVYAVFGEAFPVRYEEELKVTTAGFTSLEPAEGDAQIEKKRLGGGQILRWEFSYDTGAGLSGDEVVMVEYSGLSPLDSPPLLLTYMLILGIMTAWAHRWFRRRSGLKGNIPFMVMAVVIFAFLLYQYYAGLDSALLLGINLGTWTFLIVATRLIYPPMPEILEGRFIRPIATGSLVTPGQRGGMSTPRLSSPSAVESAKEHGETVKGWEMLHASAHENYMKKLYPKTLELLEAALKLDPDNPMLLNDKGFVLLSMGRHEEALEHFKMALKVEPDFNLARANITRCLIEKDL